MECRLLGGDAHREAEYRSLQMTLVSKSWRKDNVLQAPKNQQLKSTP